jgi:spermidine synthase
VDATSRKYREATFCGADGVVLVRKSWPTPPRLRVKEASQLFLASRSHPSSAEEGKSLPRDELISADSGEFPPGHRPRLQLLLLLAFISGTAALIYEVLWFQLLELVIGSSPVSLGILLATFMGGSCLGSLFFPRMVSNKRNPLRVYARIEIGIAVAAVLAFLLLPLVGNVYLAWGGEGLRGLLLRGCIAALLLLPPTLLMGATLPALSRCLEPIENVSSLGFLYGSNLLGAVTGSLLSAFYLLRNYDVTIATIAAALLNVAAAALSLAFTLRSSPASQEDESPIAAPPSTTNIAIYVAIAISGFCALAAEAIWTRTLSLLLGGSVYTFAMILAVFLTGLGIGSAIGSLLSKGIANAVRALGWCQLLISGAIAWTAYNLSQSLPYWPINPSISTDIWFTFQLDLDRTLWALLPPAILWGASFPLAMAALKSKGGENDSVMATIYSANTAGAILGALAASLLLIGAVGSQRAQQLLVAMSSLGAITLLWSLKRSRLAIGILTVIAAALSISIIPPLSRILVAHGRYAATWVNKGDILYAEEGLNASVAVSSFSSGALTFHVAGKIQASTVPRDMRLQRMLGHLTSLTAADPKSVLVIGCGAGITAGAVAVDPKVERLTLVEIEPLVPQAAATFFGRQNFSVLYDPRVQLHIDDGRHFLMTSREKFDGITADPLDPWVRGAANLYTREFFEAAREHLNPGGVVTVYIQLFETNMEAVKSAVATFFEVFPNGTIWGNTYEGKGHDMVLLGQAEPLKIDLEDIRNRVADPAYSNLIQSLREIEMGSPVDLFATYAGRAVDLREWLRDATLNRDRNLRMQYLAGLGLNLDDSAKIYEDLLKYRRYPEDLFIGSESELAALHASIPDK